MGREELIRHLIRGAEQRGEEIRRRAREEAERRVARAEAEAEAMEREFRETLERDAAREREQRMSRARMEARALALRARASLVDRILARLRERLSEVPAEVRYHGVAERLFREILPEMPEGNVTLFADARALKALEPLLAERRVRRAPLPEEEIGGVEASDESGAIRIRNTLRSRLENALPAMMEEIRRSVAADE